MIKIDIFSIIQIVSFRYHLLISRYTEAIPLLESIFYVREKLLSVGSIHVLLCSCELVACLSADVTSGMIDRNKRRQEAFAFAQVLRFID